MHRQGSRIAGGEAHRVVPGLHDRQAVGNFAVAAAELNGDRAVRALVRGDIVQSIGIVLVRFQIALVVKTVIDQKPSTGTSSTVSLWMVAPSFRPGVIGR